LLLIDTTEAIGETFVVKKMGPKTEPWEIPQDEGKIEDEEEPEVT